MSKKLETAVNILTVVTCVVVLGLVAAPLLPRHNSARAERFFKPGEQFPAFAGLNPEKKDKTLVMVLRSECHYCAESVPFYQRLSGLVANGEAADVALVVVTTDDQQTADEYVVRKQLRPASVVSLPRDQRRQLRVPGTPTLILIDRDRTIRKLWVGRLDADGEEAVRAALTQ